MRSEDKSRPEWPPSIDQILSCRLFFCNFLPNKRAILINHQAFLIAVVWSEVTYHRFLYNILIGVFKSMVTLVSRSGEKVLVLDVGAIGLPALFALMKFFQRNIFSLVVCHTPNANAQFDFFSGS